MNPLDPARNIINVIETYKNNTTANESDIKGVKAEVEQYFKIYSKTITPETQKTIDILLGRLISDKTNACNELETLISSVAKNTDQPLAKPPLPKLSLITKLPEPSLAKDTTKINVVVEQLFKNLLNTWRFASQEDPYRRSEFKEFIAKTTEEEKVALFLEKAKIISEVEDNYLIDPTLIIFLKDVVIDFDLYQIKDIQNQFNLIKTLALTAPDEVSKEIKNFNFSELQKFEIAKIVAQKSPKDVSENIKNFKLSPSNKEQIGLIALRQEVQSFMVPSDLEKIQLEKLDWSTLHDLPLSEYSLVRSIKLAKMHAYFDGESASSTIQKYTSFDDDDRFIIAKVAVAEASNVSQHFQKFEIKEEYKRFELAKLAAPNILKLEELKFYNLKESHRSEVELMISARNPEIYIRDHKIIKEEERFKVTQLAIKFDPETASKNIMGFNITAEHRREIAKNLALSGFEELSKVIQHFHLPNESDRIAIAKISAINEPRLTAVRLGNFEISSTVDIIDVLLTCLRHSPDEAKTIMSEHNRALTTPPCFEELSKKVAAANNEAVNTWWEAVRFACDKMKLSETERSLMVPFLTMILNHEEPQTRYALTAVLLRHGVPPPLLKGGVHTPFINLLLTPLSKEAGLNSAEIEDVWKVLRDGEYRESVKKEKVINGLYALLECRDLTGPQKGMILKHIFENKKTPAYASLQMLEAIISTNNVAHLKMGEADEKDAKATSAVSLLKMPIDLAACLNKIFTETIGMASINDFREKYLKTILKARDPPALMVYGTKLRSLSPDQRVPVLRLLKDFTTAVLNENYKKWRYDEMASNHLKTVFQGRPEMEKEWQKGEKAMTLHELFELIGSEAKEKNELANKNETLAKAKTDSTAKFNLVEDLKFYATHHLKNLQSDYKYFAACLNAPGSYKQQLEKLRQESSKDVLPSRAVYEPDNSKTKPIFMRKLEAELIQLFDPALSAEKKIDHIEKRILPKLRPISVEFSENMRKIQKDLQENVTKATKEEIEQNYTVEDTDHWEDMLLCGTEVLGSCQRISGEVYFNKCLLAYMADGKNRAIVVKNKAGKIVARCIMRLLWDGSKPVIFQERLYKNPGVPPEAIKAIDMMFAHRAKQLQAPLVRSADTEHPANFKHDLESDSSPAPFEYVDAGGVGISQGGVFTIRAASIHLL